MADLTFRCSKCEQHLEVAEEGAGQLVECPTCKNTIEIPHPKRTPPMPASSAMSPELERHVGNPVVQWWMSRPWAPRILGVLGSLLILLFAVNAFRAGMIKVGMVLLCAAVGFLLSAPLAWPW